MSTHTPSVKQIEEALCILIHAVRDKGSHLAGLLEEEYENIRNTFHGLNKNVRKRACRSICQALWIKNISLKKIRRTAEDINEQVHGEPWSSIGIAAGGAFIAGLLLGLRKNNRR